MNNDNTILSRLGNALYQIFPVHRGEWMRFIPMALMMCLILANYTVLRNLKDTLITNAPGSDANVIPYVKLLCTLPAAIIFMLFYTRIASVFKRENVFYICLFSFLAFFGLFGYVIYPNVDALHADPASIQAWRESFPRLQWVIVMLANWSYTLFYVLSELWGSAILSLLFWQFANEITKTEMAKRFYPLFGFIGNIGLIVSGTVTVRFGEQIRNSANAGNAMEQMLYLLIPALLISGIFVAICHWWMCRLSERPDFELPVRKKSKKSKPGLGESLKYIASSRYLVFMALLVVAYGVTINFIDVLWKGQVKELMPIQHPDFGKEQLKVAYLSYMAEFSRMTGFIALPLMLGGGFILRRLSWFSAANITPIILGVTGTGFFSVIAYGWWTGTASEPFMMMGETWTLVGLAASFGYWQNSLTKATKYSLFDATKEMAYFPLDDELRSKGKAAVDVVGGRAGKSGGSLFLLGLQTIFPAVALPGLSPILFAIFAIMMVGWFVAVARLHVQYEELRAQPAETGKAEEDVA